MHLWFIKKVSEAVYGNCGVSPAYLQYVITQCYLPPDTAAREAGIWFAYPTGMEGWVDLGGWLYTKMSSRY